MNHRLNEICISRLQSINQRKTLLPRCFLKRRPFCGAIFRLPKSEPHHVLRSAQNLVNYPDDKIPIPPRQRNTTENAARFRTFCSSPTAPDCLPSMAPSFDHLRDEDLDEEDFDVDEVDISDLREKYEVQLEQGYDTFVVIDGLPAVNEEQKPKLIKFLLKKLNSVGRTSEDLIYMPFGDDGMSLRYAADL